MWNWRTQLFVSVPLRFQSISGILNDNCSKLHPTAIYVYEGQYLRVFRCKKSTHNRVLCPRHCVIIAYTVPDAHWPSTIMKPCKFQFVILANSIRHSDKIQTHKFWRGKQILSNLSFAYKCHQLFLPNCIFRRWRINKNLNNRRAGTPNGHKSHKLGLDRQKTHFFFAELG